MTVEGSQLSFSSVFLQGNLLEKMKICSMPRFFCFLQDLVVPKNNYGVLVKDLHFGTIPVRLFQPKTASSGLRRGIIFYHGGGCVFGSLGKKCLRGTGKEGGSHN